MESTTVNEYQVEEVIKKSSLAAEDSFDYQKITANVQGLIPCSFQESLEEVTFAYDLTDLKALKEIKHKKKKKQETCMEEKKRRMKKSFCINTNVLQEGF